jgi:hypothetical protein
MGNKGSVNVKINFEDVQYVLRNRNQYLLINTLSSEEQDCLIINTINISDEERIINEFLKNSCKDINIVIYGKNSCDEKMHSKYNQLTALGFCKVYIYVGGLFEWLMLQDIYGEKMFPTTKKELDILKYKPNKVFDIRYIEF